MQRFVAEQNILHFKELLERESDEGRRTLILRMIAEEEAKRDAAIAAENPGPAALRKSSGA